MSYYAATAPPPPASSRALSPALDPLSLKFVIWARESGAPALHRLVDRAPTEQCRRLKVRLGQLPDIDFKAANFATIHAARVLHFLDGVAVEYSLRKFYRWLYPQGRLFVSVLTPNGAKQLSAARSNPQIYPLDERTLRREISAAGFFIEDASTYLPPWEGSQECCAVIARCTS